MIGEGEELPAAAYTWRLRLPLGGLFVPAGLGALDASPTPARAPGAVRGRPAQAAERPFRPGPARELLALFARPRLALAQAGPTNALPEPDPGSGSLEPPGLPMVRLYGPLSVDGSDGRGLGQRSTRGLIAFLVLHRGEVTSLELLDALWPGEPTELSRPRLWDTKRHAQRLLAGALERRGQRYALDSGRIAVDAEEIERATAPGSTRAALERAVGLCLGSPLADVDYPWAETERRRLHALRLDLLVRAASARLASGDAHGALAAAEELVALEPLSEDGWRLAMEAEGALGARQAIVERYARLTRELDARLGLRPGAETRATYRRLLAQG